MSDSNLYHADFYAWAQQQASLLRTGNLAAADIAHIAEEIESMGRTEKRKLVNRLSVHAASAQIPISANPPQPLLAGHHPRAASRSRRAHGG